jgi:hypothetical protein
VRHIIAGPTAYSSGEVDRFAAQLLLLDRARAGSAAPRVEDGAYHEADVPDAQTDICAVDGLGLGHRDRMRFLFDHDDVLGKTG